MSHPRKFFPGAGILVLLLIAAVSAGLSIGSTPIPLSHSISYLVHQIPFGDIVVAPNWTETEATILGKIRMPRVLLGLLVGASLSLAGVAFQGVLRNPLADPYILGISAGASVGAAVAISFGASWLVAEMLAVPVLSFAGAVLAILAVFWIGRTDRKLKTETLILAGVVVNSFMGAILTFTLTMLPGNKSQQIVLWLLGSLSLRGWEYGAAVFPFFLTGFLVVWSYSRELNSLTMGEQGAASLGVNVERTKWVLLLTASLLTAVAVSTAGMIGFVGLVIPHAVRMAAGTDHRVLIPLATLAGGIFLVLCDTIARSLLSPLELSIGVVTAAAGAPFFAWQLQRSRRGTI